MTFRTAILSIIAITCHTFVCAEIHYATFKGPAVHPYLSQVAQLRVTLFREFPYLYVSRQGAAKEDVSYYRTCSDTILVGAFDDDKLIGMVIGLPLSNYNPSGTQARERFKHIVPVIDDYFYCAEIAVQVPYQKQGIASALLKKFDEAVVQLTSYRLVGLLAIIRADNHPLRPNNSNLDNLFYRAGFICSGKTLTTKRPTLQPNGTVRIAPNTMNFWSKEVH